MLILNAADLSPYAGDSVPYSAIASSITTTPIDTFILGQPESPSVQPVILQVTGGGSGVQTFNAPLGTQRVDTVSYGTESFSAAVDPSDPQPGEFVFNSLTLQLTLNPSIPLTPGRSLLVQTVDPSAVLTEYLLTANDSLPDIFYKYNITGALAWSCGWEENPKGAFELITDWATADALEAELIPKVTQLEIFGIGFQVDSLTITKRSPLQNPNLEARVNVQLRGKWEDYLEEQVVLDSLNGTSSGSRTIRGNTTVQAIAAKVGAVATLPSNRIEAPRKSGEEEIVSLQEVFEGNLRHNGCFARYSSAGAIEAVKLDAVQIHNVSYNDLYNTELEIQINASPRALDFKNGRLEWGERVQLASTFAEDTQGNGAESLVVRWRQKPVDRQVIPTGSSDIDSPPGNIKDLIDASFVFDNGGPVKEQTITTTENGAIVRQEYVKKGFAAVAHLHLYNRSTDSNGKTIWTPRSPSLIPTFWQTVETWAADYLYSPDGWLMEIVLTGWRLLRLQSESSNESLEAWVQWNKATDPTKQAKALIKLQSYEYNTVPVIERTVYQTRLLRQHYNDIAPQPTEENEYLVPEINEDGTLNAARFSGSLETTVEREEVNGKPYLRIRQKVPVPGWADPRFCTQEISKKSAFLSRKNPDSTDKKPLPDLTSGEDKELEKMLFVPDYRYQDRTGTYAGETYLTYERLQTQKEAGFARTARETNEAQEKGRPGEHTRKEEFYEKIDPTEGDRPVDEYEYIISTTDYEDDRIVGETASYPYASTFEQAMVGLQTDLEINNTRDTKNTSAELRHALAMQEGDLVNLEGHGQWRVLNYSKSLAILAPGVFQPGRMSLDLGYRIKAPAIALTKRLKPQPTTETTSSSTGEISSPGYLIQGVQRGNSQGV